MTAVEWMKMSVASFSPINSRIDSHKFVRRDNKSRIRSLEPQNQGYHMVSSSIDLNDLMTYSGYVDVLNSISRIVKKDRLT